MKLLGWGRPISRRYCGVVYRLLMVFLIGQEGLMVMKRIEIFQEMVLSRKRGKYWSIYLREERGKERGEGEGEGQLIDHRITTHGQESYRFRAGFLESRPDADA